MGTEATHGSIAAWLRSRRALIGLVVLALGLLLGAHVMADGATESTASGSLGVVVARQGLRVDPASVVWLDAHEDWLGVTTLLLASEGPDAPRDVYHAVVRRSGNAVVDVSNVVNLTRSPAADERDLAALGPSHVVFASETTEGVVAVTRLDARGVQRSQLEGWSGMAWRQLQITNLQETGRGEGFRAVRYQLSEPARGASLTVTGERARLADWLEVGLEDAPVAGAERVEVQRQDPGMPGGITWVVDTVRNISFVGPEPIEWLENRVFRIQDFVARTRYAWFGADSGRESIDLGTQATQLTDEQRQLLTAATVESGFPPAPLEPRIRPGAEGEGVWVPVAHDPFVNEYPNAPPAFAQTYLRPDPERPFVTVAITAWDPRQVQLRIVAGTREPESATGQRGSGEVPRDASTTRFLVGAFDGGFQAMHGEFGMMAEDRVYLPPKPWAATIAVFDDGRIGIGSWPAPNWSGRYYDENLANRQIPPEIAELRQNLTSVVEDRRFNPWERWWWGAAPPGASEQTLTHRSGVCLTEEGFVAFFWGGGLSPEALGEGMVRARCVRALHLDMNSGHCGMEFFRPHAETADPRDPPLPALAAIDRDSQYDGVFPRAQGMRLRARKAVPSMQMRFPRYIERDPRDFFYLTLRPVLPGPALMGGATFSSEGLPHSGWPYAFARAQAGDVRLARVDLRRVVPRPLARERHVRTLAVLARPLAGTHAIVAIDGVTSRSFRLEAVGGSAREILRAPLASEQSPSAAAVDRDGFLLIAQGPNALATLRAEGLSIALDLGADPLHFVTEAGHADLAGAPVAARDGVDLLAEEAREAEVLFPDTTPMPYSRWGYLQGQRVRYFPTQPPRFVRPSE